MNMGMTVSLPELNIKEDELKLLLAIKLFEDGVVSLGKASEIAGYSEKAFAEVLVHKGIAPVKYEKLDLNKELRNA
jgi:predicted HTH domain antitoxin